MATGFDSRLRIFPQVRIQVKQSCSAAFNWMRLAIH
jgi:hypothetical protein